MMFYLYYTDSVGKNMVRYFHSSQEDELEPATSVLNVEANDLVKYVMREIPIQGEPLWSVDYVSDFSIRHLFISYLNVCHGVLSYFHFYSGPSCCG